MAELGGTPIPDSLALSLALAELTALREQVTEVRKILTDEKLSWSRAAIEALALLDSPAPEKPE